MEMKRILSFAAACAALFNLAVVCAVQLGNETHCFCSLKDDRKGINKCPSSNDTNLIYYRFNQFEITGNTTFSRCYMEHLDEGIFKCPFLPTRVNVFRLAVQYARELSEHNSINHWVPVYPMRSWRMYQFDDVDFDSSNSTSNKIWTNFTFIISDGNELTNDTAHLTMGWLQPFILENAITAALNSLVNPLHLLSFHACGFHFKLSDQTFNNVTNLVMLGLVKMNISHLPLNMIKHLLKLKTLDLRHNQLKTIPEKFFQAQQSLQKLDLSNNEFWYLGDCDTIPHSILADRCNRSSNFLQHLQNLLVLDLSFNQVSKIGSTFFQAQQQSLKLLDLSHNKFWYLGDCDTIIPHSILIDRCNRSSNFLHHLQTLLDLDLSFNQISKISSTFFQSGKKIFRLNLSCNSLTTLVGICTSEDNDLNLLHLSYNNLETLSPIDFWCLKHLIVLELSGNHLSHIHELTFQNLKHVDRINFDHNFLNFHSISTKIVFGENILEIKMNNNHLHKIPPILFSNLNNLQKLHFNDNDITYVNMNDFDHLLTNENYWSDREIVIFLRNNPIITLDFQNYLHGTNKLSSSTNVIFILSDIQIRCDCNLKWLSEYDNDTNPFKFVIDEMRCKEPPSLEGQSFKSIPTTLLHCVDQHKCPINCSCLPTNEKSLFIDCMNAGLRTIPSLILNGTTGLNLDFNSLINLNFSSPTATSSQWNLLLDLSLTSSVEQRIVQLETNPFSDLIKLDRLNLRKNNLTRLSNNFFKGLVQLSQLDLSFNRLTQLPDDIFDQLPNLKSLNLGHNELTNLSNDLFRNNALLQVLRFPFNRIMSLEHIFSNSINLEMIDMGNNEINFVNDTIWPRKLKQLLFDSNNISTFVFQNLPPTLQLLDLKNNSIAAIDTNEILGFESVLINLESNRIRFVHFEQSDHFSLTQRNGSIIKLDFNPIVCDEQNLPLLKNIIQNETDNDEYNFGQIRFGVGDLYCREPLFMKGKLLQHETDLPKRELTCPNGCECFRLNENIYRILQCTDIKEISMNSKFETKMEIKCLIARDGRMTSLNYLQLDQYQRLETLDIKNFKASKNLFVLHPPVFDKMKGLKSLTLVRCQISEIDEVAFSHLNQLTELDVSSNEIKQLSPNTLRSTNKLEILDLSHNQIRNLSHQIFENLTNLKRLKINNNHLISIGIKLLAKCTNLQVLDLSRNNLATDEIGDLLIPTNIQSLNFSHNKLMTINDSWIESNALYYIDFSYNQIKLNDRTIMINTLVEIVTIHLNNNNLTKFPFELSRKTFLGGKMELTMSNNPFNCDCQLNNFVQLIQSGNGNDIVVIDRNSVACSSPQPLKDKRVKDLQIHHLRCPLDGCPQFCSCYQYNSSAQLLRVVESYNQQRLAQIPNNCPPNIEVLIVNSTSIKSLNGIENECWKNLTRLTITNNQLDRLLNSNLQMQTKLIELRLPRNQLVTIPNEFLKNTIHLEILDLSYNKLMSFSGELISHLKILNNLDISHNRINSIESSPFIDSLEVLNVSGNQIRSLFIPLRVKDYKLRHFNISSNLLQNIGNQSNNFQKLKRLRVLDVARNNLSFNCKSSVENFLPLSLHFLYISHNYLQCINFCNWTLYGRLKLIDLSFNNVSNLNLKDLVFANDTNVTVRCESCNIKQYSQHLSETRPIKNRLFLDISNNDVECLCQLTKFHHGQPLLKNGNFTIAFRVIDNFACYFNEKLIVLSNFTRDTPACIVKDQCPNGCLCLKPEFESVGRIAMFCNNSRLTRIPSFCPQNTQSLNLDDNNVTELIGLNEIHWQNLTHVSIRNNNLKVISDSNWPPSLKTMHLDGNELKIPSGWLEMLVNNSIFPFSISLSNNPWACNCSNVKFKKWLIEGEATVLDLRNITGCANETHFIGMNLCNDAAQIPKTSSNIIVICILVLSVIAVSVSAFFVYYYKNKSKVLMWLYSKRMCMFCINSDDVDFDKEYDAFVSYANEDEDFVQNVLLPTLENSEENDFKICDHARDWILGEQIIDQIWTSIEKSRRVIIVMSENFVQSVWAAMEFQLAILKSMDDKLNRIIVIMLDENLSLDGLDPQLRLYVTMNTYLKRSDPRFWAKLLYKMPRVKMNKNREPPTNELSDQIELLPPS